MTRFIVLALVAIATVLGQDASNGDPRPIPSKAGCRFVKAAGNLQWYGPCSEEDIQARMDWEVRHGYVPQAQRQTARNGSNSSPQHGRDYGARVNGRVAPGMFPSTHIDAETLAALNFESMSALFRAVGERSIADYLDDTDIQYRKTAAEAEQYKSMLKPCPEAVPGTRWNMVLECSNLALRNMVVGAGLGKAEQAVEVEGSLILQRDVKKYLTLRQGIRLVRFHADAEKEAKVAMNQVNFSQPSATGDGRRFNSVKERNKAIGGARKQQGKAFELIQEIFREKISLSLMALNPNSCWIKESSKASAAQAASGLAALYSDGINQMQAEDALEKIIFRGKMIGSGVLEQWVSAQKPLPGVAMDREMLFGRFGTYGCVDEKAGNLGFNRFAAFNRFWGGLLRCSLRLWWLRRCWLWLGRLRHVPVRHSLRSLMGMGAGFTEPRPHSSPSVL